MRPSLELIRQAVTIRLVEERLLELYAQGVVHGTVHTCVGQEWSGVAVCHGLKKGDMIFSNHRCHGHFLSWCDDLDGFLGEILGRHSGVCAGRGGSQHLAAEGFFSNGIIGGMAPVSAGAAWALKARKKGEIAVLFIGDGAMNQGVVFEALNAASLFELPLLIVCEANGISQSTEIHSVQAGSLAGRAAAFAIDVLESDTWNPEKLVMDAGRAIALVRSRLRPLLLIVHTFRLNPHSKGDDLRPKTLLESNRHKDPVQRLFEEGGEEFCVLLEGCRQRLDHAVKKALAAPMSRGIPTANPPGLRPRVEWNLAPTPPGTMVSRLRSGWKKAMLADERVIFLGEDVEDPYGGAFKVSKGLSHQFPGRVRNMPISEAAIVGMGVGLALSGVRPVVEIMFGDFLTLAFDQLLNHAAKFYDMYGGRYHVPLIVRTPMGGRRGYGPTHSQSLEKHFLGIPGLQVVALHHRMDVEAMIQTLSGHIQHPLLLVENKTSYERDGDDGKIQGFSYRETGGIFPTLLIHPQTSPDLVILGYGGMVAEIEKAMDILFEEHERFCVGLIPAMLYPFDCGPVLAILDETDKLLIVEEGPGFCGMGAEIIALVGEHCEKKIYVRRLSGLPHAIPSAVTAEADHLPDASAIVRAALAMLKPGDILEG